MKKIYSKKAGFSLIELIFAIFFITIIVFGVVKLQSSNLAMLNTQNNEIRAHFLANEGITIVEALGYDSGFLSCTPCSIKLSGSDYSLSVGGVETFPDSPFERTIEIDATGLTEAYKATAIIEWEDSTGAHNATEGGEITAKRIIY